VIEQKIFDYGIELLDSYFGKKLNEAVQGIWFEYLDEKLTSEEFLAAVKNSLLRSRFMPTASELVEFIHGSKEAKALQEWQSVLLAASRGDESQLAYISQRGRVALHAIGGLKTVGLAEEYRRSQLEKSFITVYCQCADKDAASLPPSVSQPTVTRTNEDYAPMPGYLKQQMEQLKTKISMNGNGKHRN
jgi:hypothetical protein